MAARASISARADQGWRRGRPACASSQPVPGVVLLCGRFEVSMKR